MQTYIEIYINICNKYKFLGIEILKLYMLLYRNFSLDIFEKREFSS